MIRIAARAFAGAVAARYAPSRRQRRVARVLPQIGRRAPRPGRRGTPRIGLTLRLTQRFAVEGRTVVSQVRSGAWIERVTQHTATRQILERTQRVEQVTLRSGALSQLRVRQEGASRPSALIALPALPRVLRQAAQPAPNAYEPRVSQHAPGRHEPAKPATIDIARLTDEVMRGIDKRIAAWRERRGRV